MTALLPDIAGLAACPGTVQYNTGLTDFNNMLTTQRALFEQLDQLVGSEAKGL